MEVEKSVRYSAVGVMSGSSLDGVDLALCEFVVEAGVWSYNIVEARTVPYSASFQQRLADAMQGTALEAARLHRDLGDLIGTACKDLLDGRKVDLIASHGHTLFHKPEEGLTIQIGCGARVAAVTGMPVVNDFRTMDVAFGGQGAPLVPLGERFLFPEYKAFLNIGGICNIALHGPERVVGYDVCIGNQALNYLANEAGMAYDADGGLARSGRIIPELLGTLNALPFHHQEPPRSLGREWFDEQLNPLISDTAQPVANRLRTVVEHIAQQVMMALEGTKEPVLVTGGGAHNGFLVERLRSLSSSPIEVPERATLDYKEALVFALLGVLRLRGEVNCLASVTGAKHDSIGGSLYHPN